MESNTVHQSVIRMDDVSDSDLNELGDKSAKRNVNPNVNEIKNKETECETASKKAKSCTSDVWRHFTKIGVEDGKERAKCNGCGQKYVIGGTKIGTSTLLRHVKKCKLIPKYHDMAAMIIDHAGKLRSREIDHRCVREVISMAIIEHGLPFNFVEYKWIRELHSLLNPEVKHFSRNTVVSDIWKFHLEQKEKLKLLMHRSRNRICLTSDCWTACTVEGYICLTAHFVDNQWNLNSKILAFCKMEPPHTGFDLAEKVFNCLKDWGIDKKIFSITLDNARANDNMQDVLIQRLSLQNSLLCEGEFFHVRCSAHILNLIVQEGLKIASGALHKIRESIKYVKASEGRKIVFKECVDEVGGIDTNVGLRLDVSTRWNSTFVMLESGLKYRRAFSTFSLRDRNYKSSPSNDEWIRGEKMCEFLRPFYLMTNLISGTSYPTSNLYFMQVWKIESLLRENVKSDDPVISEMAQRMLGKFSKYWDDYSVILAIAAILDPRMKFDALKFFYNKLDSSTSAIKLEHIKNKIYKLYEEYVKQDAGEGSASSSQTNLLAQSSNPEDDHDMDAFHEYINYVSQNVLVNGKSELDIYLDDGHLEPNLNKKLDVLKWWNDRQHRFPILSRMACDLLSIPITTVVSESTFSIGARVLNKYRCSLLPDNVQALILTRNWINGFSPMPEDEDNRENEDDEDQIDLSKHDSNTLRSSETS